MLKVSMAAKPKLGLAKCILKSIAVPTVRNLERSKVIEIANAYCMNLKFGQPCLVSELKTLMGFGNES